MPKASADLAAPRYRLRWPRLTRLPLALEIALALLLKILILTLLWKAFFAHPQAQHMRMPLPRVEQHLLSASAASAASAADPQATPEFATHTKDGHELYR